MRPHCEKSEKTVIMSLNRGLLLSRLRYEAFVPNHTASHPSLWDLHYRNTHSHDQGNLMNHISLTRLHGVANGNNFLTFFSQWDHKSWNPNSDTSLLLCQFWNLNPTAQSVGLLGWVISCVTRPHYRHRTTQMQNKRRYSFTPRVGFKPTIPQFQRAKIFRALCRAPAVIGRLCILPVSVGIATRLATGWRPTGRSSGPGSFQNVFFSTSISSRPAYGSSNLLSHKYRGLPPPGGGGEYGEVNHAPPTSATPPCVFIA
jgi:hypothetical protein